ncbi:MAG: acylphosphatase [Candidatus Dormibacteria bacterium]
MAAPDAPPFRHVLRRRCQIGGRVQMVGFRMFAVDHALRLRLRGWVRNLPQGDVEVVVEGREPELKEFLRLLHSGPPAASVTSFVVADETSGSKLEAFRVVD